MKRALTLIAAAGFMGLLVVVANASSSIVISGGGGGSGITQAQADQLYLKNDAGAVTAAGGALAGHLSVDGGATLSNGVLINGVSGSLTPVAGNIAVGKTTAQSTTYSDYYSGKAVDGDTGTFSTTNSSTIGEWIKIDLGSLRIVRQMVINKQAPYADRPASFLVQAADDWTFLSNVRTVATVAGDANNVTTVTFASPGSGRYWRLLTTQPEYIAIREWEIYESLAGPLVTVNGDMQVSGGVATPSTVKYYGAACDGLTDDTAAIQAALSASHEVELPAGATCVVGNLSIALDGTHLFGHGVGSVLKASPGFSGTMLNVGVHPVVLEDFEMLGPSDTSKKNDPASFASINGISINSQTAGVITGLTIHGFTGYALYWINDVRDRLSHFAISDSEFYNNYCAVYFSQYAEYQRMTGLQLHDNRIGLQVYAGNIVGSALDINDNGYGLRLLGTGWANNGHGSLSASMINHSSVRSIDCKDITIGFAISGSQIHEGPILLDACTGVSITDGVFDVESLSFAGGGRNVIGRNFVYGAYANTITHDVGGAADNTIVVGNYYATGTPLAEGAVFTNNSAAVTYPDAILIDNRTAATAGTPFQNPGCIRFAGHGYSGSDYTEECRICLDGGAATGAQSLKVQCKYAATGWANAMTLQPYATNSVIFPYGGTFNGSVAINAGTFYPPTLVQYATSATGGKTCSAAGHAGTEYWRQTATGTCRCSCAYNGSAYAWIAAVLAGSCSASDC